MAILYAGRLNILGERQSESDISRPNARTASFF
jgi:hypothetical protein